MNDAEHKPWATSEGTQVRRAGAPYNTSNTGIVVEHIAHPLPSACGVDETDPQAREDWATQFNLAQAMPAQIKVYWKQTGLIEQLLSTEVEANYPGGAQYRAWDREFPLFSIEQGGYGDVSVYTPDGEQAIQVFGPDFPDLEWDDLIEYAVRLYLSKMAEIPAAEPVEPDTQEQFENAEFENAS